MLFARWSEKEWFDDRRKGAGKWGFLMRGGSMIINSLMVGRMAGISDCFEWLDELADVGLNG